MYEIECRLRYPIMPIAFRNFLKELTNIYGEPINQGISYWNNFRFYDNNKLECKYPIKKYSKYILINDNWYKFVVSNEINVLANAIKRNKLIKIFNYLAFSKHPDLRINRYYWSFEKSQYKWRFSLNENVTRGNYSFECEIELDETLRNLKTFREKTCMRKLIAIINNNKTIVLLFNRMNLFGLNTISSDNIDECNVTNFDIGEIIYKSEIVRQTVLPNLAFRLKSLSRNNYFSVKWDGIYGNVWLYFDNILMKKVAKCLWEDGVNWTIELDRHDIINNERRGGGDDNNNFVSIVSNVFCFSAERLSLNANAKSNIVLLDVLSVNFVPIFIDSNHYKCVSKFLQNVIEHVNNARFACQEYYGFLRECELKYLQTHSRNDGILVFNQFKNEIIKIKSKNTVELMYVSSLNFTDILFEKHSDQFKIKKNNSTIPIVLNKIGDHYLFLDRDKNIYIYIGNKKHIDTHKNVSNNKKYCPIKLKIGKIYECILSNKCNVIVRICGLRSDRFFPNTKQTIDLNRSKIK